MAQIYEFLIYKILLGLTQGITPGRLIALIFSETIEYGKREGIKIAISPSITDSLIVSLSLLILSNLAEYGVVVGMVSLFGACYLIYLVFQIRASARCIGFHDANFPKDKGLRN